jgi:hypothetical protein
METLMEIKWDVLKVSDLNNYSDYYEIYLDGDRKKLVIKRADYKI